MSNFNIIQSYQFETPDIVSVEPILLLGRHVKINNAYTSPAHTHPIWQMEIPYSAGIMVIGNKKIELDCNDLLIIPPGTLHQFKYDKAGIEFVTLRFQVDGITPQSQIILAPGNAFFQSVRSAIITFLGSQPHVDINKIYAIRALILSIISLLFIPERPDQYRGVSELVYKVEAIVHGRIGERIRIRDIANDLGLSVDNLSRNFKRDANMTLKQYIDKCRAEEATKILMHTSDLVSEVAFQLGFPDVYSFSRFYKKMTGKSPSAYRHA